MEEVYAYLDKRYNLKEVDRNYFSGDGAKWIKEGTKYIPNITFVLDRFHMVKYVKKACIGMLDSKQLVLDWIDQNQQHTDYVGCSAEGHVSHVLSSSLSSRPLDGVKQAPITLPKCVYF